MLSVSCLLAAVSSHCLFTAAPHSSSPRTVRRCFLISCIDKKKKETSESSLLSSCSARSSERKDASFLFLMTLIGFPQKEKAEQCSSSCRQMSVVPIKSKARFEQTSKMLGGGGRSAHFPPTDKGLTSRAVQWPVDGAKL